MLIEQCFPAWLLCCSDISVLATAPVLIPESGEGKEIVVKESKQLTVPWGVGIEEVDLGLVDGESPRKVSVAFFLCEKVILFCCYISIKGRLFVCFGFPMPVCSLNLKSDFVLRPVIGIGTGGEWNLKAWTALIYRSYILILWNFLILSIRVNHAQLPLMTYFGYLRECCLCCV